MKTLCRFWIAFTLAAWLATTHAQQPSAADDKADSPWVIRTFRVDIASNSDFNPSHFPAEPADPFALGGGPPPLVEATSPFPAPLPAGASDHAWAEHLKKSTVALSKVFDLLGAPGPQGMVALYDAYSSTLVVRTTKEHAAQLAPAMEIISAKIPRDVVVTMEVVEASAGLICSLVNETAGRGDHSPEWKRCGEWLITGKAKSMGQFQLNTRSGQRVSVKSGWETTPLQELQIDSSGRVAAIRGGARSAVEFETDASVSPDFVSVDLPFSFRFDYAPPIGRTEKITALVGTSDIECPVLDYQVAMITTNLTLAFGTHKLAGVWHPRGRPEYANGGIMQAAFLNAEAPLALPNATEDLVTRLEKHAPAPPAIAKATPLVEEPKEQDPKAVISRIVKVPPTFFGLAPMEKGNCNIQRLLEAQGIPFPEGTNATYNAMAGTLNVKNTARAIDLIKGYMEDVCRIPPQHISCTAYFVEGETSTIRQLADETRHGSDHTKIWEHAKKLSDSGLLRIVEVVRGEGRSGDRVEVQTGTDRSSIGEILLNRISSAESKTDKSNSATPADQPAAPGPSTDNAKPAKPSLITIPIESQMVGTSMEWDPIITPDGRYVELNIAFDHHFAPPTDRQVTSAPGAITPAGTPGTQVHFAHQLSSITFVPGTTRLMSTWKTEGSPTHEGRDISQAVFLRVDVIPFAPPAD